MLVETKHICLSLMLACVLDLYYSTACIFTLKKLNILILIIEGVM
jgi:hypothetical protein